MNYLMIKCLVLVPLYLMGIVANILTLVVGIGGRLVQSSKVWVIVLAMTVADLGACTLSFLAFFGAATGVHFLGSPDSVASGWAGAAMGLFYNADQFSLTAATLLQAKAMASHGWLQAKLTMKRTLAVVAAIVLIPFMTLTIFEIPPVGLSRFAWNQTAGEWAADLSRPLTEAVEMTTFFVHGPTLALACLVADLFIFKVVWRSSRSVADSLDEELRRERERKNRKMTLQFVYINSVYIVMTVISIFAFPFLGAIESEFGQFLVQLSFDVLAVVLVGGNFFVYYFSNDTFKAKFHAVVRGEGAEASAVRAIESKYSKFTK